LAGQDSKEKSSTEEKPTNKGKLQQKEESSQEAEKKGQKL